MIADYELDELLDFEDELELESLEESEVSESDDDELDESLSLEESELDLFEESAFFNFFTGGSDFDASELPASVLFLRFLFKIFVRLSLIKILRLFLHS